MKFFDKLRMKWLDIYGKIQGRLSGKCLTIQGEYALEYFENRMTGEIDENHRIERWEQMIEKVKEGFKKQIGEEISEKDAAALLVYYLGNLPKERD